MLTLVLGVALSSCAGDPPPEPPPTRSPDQPILGVTSPGAEHPECVDSVVKRKTSTPMAEITIKGQQGDRFSYVIEEKSGRTGTGESAAFEPGQRDILFETGINNADIATITVYAQGRVGRPGTCVLRAIR